MSRYRAIIRLSALLAGLALPWACGDSPTEPPPQPDPPRPTTLTVSPATAELTALGATVHLTAEVRDQNARVMAGATVTWSSGDTSVATVDASGLVTGVTEGMATITASAEPASGSAEVTVTQLVASVKVSPAAGTIGLGSTLQLTAEGFDENGVAVEGAEFVWESSDTSVATVDASGLVTGVAAGPATITATAGNGQGTAELAVIDPQRAALEALYEATDGPNWANADQWLTDAPLGEWYRVATDASGRVVGLDLEGNGLSGPIPPELGNLTSLRTLFLTRNGLSGPIPPEIGSLTSLLGLSLQSNDLSGPIPPELGNLTSLTTLFLADTDLSGPIPPEIGSLTNLRSLSLQSNDLSGPIPPELGNLTSLVWLRLDENGLTGLTPESMLQIDGLRSFRFGGNVGLCAPATSEFVTWLQAVDRVEGPYCNDSDMAVLEVLYETLGGTDWINADGWPETPLLEEWHGVATDSLGRVVALDLAGNGLEGRLRADLGNLAALTTLRIGDNALRGRLPLSLADLDLVEFHYAGTGLCVPADASFQTWLFGIASHEGTGAECDPLSDREVLEALYDTMGGRNWRDARNWLTDTPLGGWAGVSADPSGHVIHLNLQANNMSGPIPPELGSLTSLTHLFVSGNELSGPIPPELVDLPSLEVLDLESNNLSGPIPPELADITSLVQLSFNDNNLSGPIPPELGSLTSLRHLQLWGNELSGPIPPELGDLASLYSLDLGNNGLTGPIPPELGNLPKLEALRLERNNLSGPIPPELGSLANLFLLYLHDNGLTGPVPPEFGRLSSLVRLNLASNPPLSGPLPATLTNLRRLEILMAGGTGLCAPTDPEFQVWLQGVVQRRVAPCGV